MSDKTVRTSLNFMGNSIKHAKINPLPADPAPQNREPWAPWFNTTRREFCWFDDTGALVCALTSTTLSTSYESLRLNGGDVIPQSFNPQRTHVFIDIDNMTADLSLDGWMPTAPTGTNVEFRFRKIDVSGFAITRTDPVTGATLAYVDQRHEFITLAWDGSNGTLTHI